MNYDFPTKRDWRRKIWGQIVQGLERIQIKPRDAVVLYFAGEKDFDREIALKKGFKAHNLISIEHKASICRQLRKNGVLTIHGDAWDVFEGFGNLPVHVFFGDFCSGLSRVPSLLAINLPFAWQFQKSVVAFNLMRGRDKWDPAMAKRVFGRHRGDAAFDLSLSSILSLLKKWENENPTVRAGAFNFKECNTGEWIIGTHSYLSESGQMFDSAVYVNPTPYQFTRVTLAIERKIYGQPLSRVSNNPDHWLEKAIDADLNNKITRQCMAVQAARTRRAE